MPWITLTRPDGTALTIRTEAIHAIADAQDENESTFGRGTTVYTAGQMFEVTEDRLQINVAIANTAGSAP